MSPTPLSNGSGGLAAPPPPIASSSRGENDEGDGLSYHRGFSNHHESESVPGTLPLGRNNPRLVPGRLYAEQLSGTAFTRPRSENRRTWLYRIRPGAAGTSDGFRPCGDGDGDGAGGLPRHFGRCDWSGGGLRLDPNPMRWGPVPLPSEESGGASEEGGEGGGGTDFVAGMRTVAGSGDPSSRNGVAIHTYSIDADMTGNDRSGGSGGEDRHMYDSDGDLLLVPQEGTLDVTTELGRMVVRPREICVLPRGVVFSINVLAPLDDATYAVASSAENAGGSGLKRRKEARGYALEIFRGHFALPELGPIGSNGLANARDFLVPTARYESDPNVANRPCSVINKFGNELFVRTSPRSPYNVVAWHGNYVPYKYDLAKFCAVNSVSYDHIDPSIYTVLTARSDEEGTALADFVVFPPRIMATDEDTLRPPWFHRNVMSEFMGLIYGEYDAKSSSGSGDDDGDGDGKGEKKGGGFRPGGASLHNTMTPHGPDAATYKKAVADPCDKPKKFEGGMAFMFETGLTLKVSEYALGCGHREREYARCWDGLEDEFTGWMKERDAGKKKKEEEEERM